MNHAGFISPTLTLSLSNELTHDSRFSYNTFSALRKCLETSADSRPVVSMSRADFIHDVTLHMPEVSARIEEDDFGIIHLEMGAMKLATQDAIAHYDFFRVRRHFSFISYLFEHAGNDLHDAIMVSYVQALFLDEKRRVYLNARVLLPANLAEALRKAELRFELIEAGLQT